MHGGHRAREADPANSGEVPRKFLDGERARRALSETERRRTSLDLARANTQGAQILSLLRAAGPWGCTNTRLFGVCHAINARINDLRRQGCDIEAKSEGGGVWRYTLLSEPASAKPPSPSRPSTVPRLTGKPPPQAQQTAFSFGTDRE